MFLISKLYFQLNSSYGAFDARLNGITGNNNPGSWSPRLVSGLRTMDSGGFG